MRRIHRDYLLIAGMFLSGCYVLLTGLTVSGVWKATIRATLSCMISLEVSSAALVGLDSVSMILTLMGSFFPNLSM